MKQIIAFAGSTSKTSINKQLVTYTASLVDNAQATVLDLNDFSLPLFSVDLQKEQGIPDNALKFLDYIKNSDGIVVSLAEHNGAYSAAFKNIFDWMSRAEQKLFMDKPMLLMATSTGARGGASVLEIAKDRFPRHSAQVVATFSLPLFNDNFSDGKVSNDDLNSDLKSAVLTFKNSL